MSWPMVELKKLVLKVDKWNPVKDGGDDQITYIDLSSVDKDSKVIKNEDVQKIQACLAPSRARQLVDSADVLVATVRPNLNGVALVSSDYQGATASTGYCVLRPNNKLLDSKYLFYWVQTESFVSDMMGKATGANYPAVSDKIVKESQIPLPPLDEQKRIAAILDKADAIRQKRKQAIVLADEFLHSVFLEMFGDPVSNPKGWEVKPLSELIMKGDKINYGIVQPGDHVEDGIPIVRVGDIKDGSIDKSKLKRVARIIDEKHSKSRLVGDEILITCVGATVGKVALADASLSGFNTVRALTRVRLNEEVNRSFVFRYLQSPFIQGYFQSQLRTVGQPTLNGKQIGETPILLPNLNMQREFLQLSDMAQTAKDLSNSQLIEADNMFNALSQKAFSGQL